MKKNMAKKTEGLRESLRSRGPGGSGYTMIEMVLVMVILSTLSMGAAMYMNPLMDLMVLQNFKQGYGAEGKMAFVRMSREISQIRDEQSTSVLIANTSQISFVNVSDQTITYNLSSGNLTRRLDNGSDLVMAKGVSELTFQYWDDSTQPPAELDSTPLSASVVENDLTRIEITLTVASGPNSQTFRTQIRPRNFKG